ncbi:hypothetical protein Tco_0559985 [Tanacetum coccineum]
MVKSWLVQGQTVSGKDYSNLLIADSLLKTIWFINAPCYDNEALASPKANGLTIPEQTATGKGTSNPFMADKVAVEEREKFSVEERAKFLQDTIAAQRRFLAEQRAIAIRNKPPTRT